MPETPTTSALQIQPKVTAAAIGGALATVATVIAEASGIAITAELSSAVTVLFCVVCGWAVKA